MVYYMEMVIDLQMLLYRGTDRFSELLYGDTNRSLGLIIWRYPEVLRSHYMQVPTGPHNLLYVGAHTSLD
jgi:hypothetical protein